MFKLIRKIFRRKNYKKDYYELLQRYNELQKTLPIMHGSTNDLYNALRKYNMYGLPISSLDEDILGEINVLILSDPQGDFNRFREYFNLEVKPVIATSKFYEFD